MIATFIALAALTVSDDSVRAFVDACERRRPEVIAELESQIKAKRGQTKIGGNVKELRKQIDDLAADLAAVRRFDSRCLGLCAPTLELSQKFHNDLSTTPGAAIPLRIPTPGEILRPESEPLTAVADRKSRDIAVTWAKGLVVVVDCSPLALDLAERSGNYYLPALVKVVDIKRLPGDEATVFVEEVADLKLIESEWLARHGKSTSASSRK